eukprot:jgi/Mesen1/4517/ME000023S03887
MPAKKKNQKKKQAKNAAAGFPASSSLSNVSDSGANSVEPTPPASPRADSGSNEVVEQANPKDVAPNPRDAPAPVEQPKEGANMASADKKEAETKTPVLPPLNDALEKIGAVAPPESKSASKSEPAPLKSASAETRSPLPPLDEALQKLGAVASPEAKSASVSDAPQVKSASASVSTGIETAEAGKKVQAGSNKSEGKQSAAAEVAPAVAAPEDEAEVPASLVKEIESKAVASSATVSDLAVEKVAAGSGSAEELQSALVERAGTQPYTPPETKDAEAAAILSASGAEETVAVAPAVQEEAEVSAELPLSASPESATAVSPSPAPVSETKGSPASEISAEQSPAPHGTGEEKAPASPSITISNGVLPAPGVVTSLAASVVTDKRDAHVAALAAAEEVIKEVDVTHQGDKEKAAAAAIVTVNGETQLLAKVAPADGASKPQIIHADGPVEPKPVEGCFGVVMWVFGFKK